MAAAAVSRSVSSTSARADSVAKPKCNNLSLKLKYYEAIKAVEEEPKIGVCKLAELFSYGKT